MRFPPTNFYKQIKTIAIVLAAALILVVSNLFFMKLGGILALITGLFFLQYFHDKQTPSSMPSFLLSLITKNLGYIFTAYLLQKTLCGFEMLNYGICTQNNLDRVIFLQAVLVSIPTLLVFVSILIYLARKAITKTAD